MSAKNKSLEKDEKEKDREKDKEKSKKSKGSSSSSGSKSKKKDKEAKKEEIKVYKIEIRKLPTNNFNEDNFKGCLSTALSLLAIKEEDVSVLHFMTGKIRFDVCCCLDLI